MPHDRSRLAAEGAAKAGRDFARVRKAAYIYTAVTENGRAAIDAVRGKIAFLMRNEFLAENVAQSGIEIDREAVMDAVRRRDLDSAARLVPDEAAEAFAIAGSPSALPGPARSDYLNAGIDEPVLSILGEGRDRELGFELLGAYAPA